MASYWFGEVCGGTCTPCPSREPGFLSDRLDSIVSCSPGFHTFSWETARDCGFVSTREEYLAVLRSLCIFRAEKALAGISSLPEQQLLHMVRMLDQVDEAVNLLSGTALEWHAANNPSFSRKYREVRGRKAVEVLSASGNHVLVAVATEMEHLSGIRNEVAREIHLLAAEVAPNTSGLVGGVVAARLISAAGGLARLARLPAATIQVLGARLSLFSHLKTGTPPPKHGIIYQHRRVHATGKKRRGKVSRTLSAKIAIAARIDHFRGKPDQEFLASADRAIGRAGGRE